jgi:hypothetical protein
MSKFASRKTPTYILSEEAANDQIVAMLDYYDIDVEKLSEGSDKESKRAARAIERALEQLSEHVRTGKLQFERNAAGKLEVIQTLVNGETLTYREIDAKAKLAMECFDPNAGYSRTYAFMGSLSGIGKAAIEKMSAVDLSVTELLGTVFLNA